MSTVKILLWTFITLSSAMMLFMAVSIISLIFKNNKYLLEIRNLRKDIKRSNENPLFKMSYPELETYLNMILIREMIFIITKEINPVDPNRDQEIYTRLLISFMEFFSDNINEFSSKLGPHYLENFVTASFNKLSIDGEIDKLINRYAVK